MNERSSRSHAIFTITVECSEKGPDGQHHVRMGKLHLVDLAVSTNHCLNSCMMAAGYLKVCLLLKISRY